MPSGKNRKASRHAFLYRFLATGLALSLLAPGLAGCRQPEPSFYALLALIDQQGEQAGEERFAAAWPLAANSQQRLQLLKRAMQRGYAFSRPLAVQAAAQPLSRPVALAVFDILLENAEFSLALQVHERSLDPAADAWLLGEAVWLAAVAGDYAALEGRFAFIARNAPEDWPELVWLAALLAMLEGQPAAAATILTSIPDRLRPSAGLLWDAGAYQSLVDGYRGLERPEDRLLAASAAVFTGQARLGLEMLESLLSAPPASTADESTPADPGWRTMATQMAGYLHYRIAEQAGYYRSDRSEPRGWLADNLSLPQDALLQAHHQRAAELYMGLHGSTDPVARQNYLRWLLASQQTPAFLLAVDRIPRAERDAWLILAASLIEDSPQRSAAWLVDWLAADSRSPGLSLDQAMNSLLWLEAWDSYTYVLERIRQTGGPLPAWTAMPLFTAYSHALRGEPVASREAFEGLGATALPALGLAEDIVPFNLGLLSLQSQEYRQAYDYFMIAAHYSPNGPARAEAKLWAARSLQKLGQSEVARDLARSALSDDPQSVQIPLFLLQSGH